MKSRKVAIIAILISALLVAAVVDKEIRQNGSVVDNGKSVISGITKLLPGSFRTEESILEEQRRMEEKIRQDSIKLEKLPKYDRLTFLIGTPYSGSLAIPATWEGKYRASEDGRTFELDYFSPKTTLPLIKIFLVNEAEWLVMKNDPQNKLLEDRGEFKFIYKLLPVISGDKAYKEFQAGLPQILKSFRSVKL